MRFLGLFSARGTDRYARGMQVICRTQRGLESGEVLSESNPAAEEQLKNAPGGQIVRKQSPEDINELIHIHSKERNEFEVALRQVSRLKMNMQLVDVEHIFGGERVVIYYISEDRVDFRDLVKSLAGEFQTRIEMRQIGVRDEAKLLADYGDCGKPLCCNTHLLEMPPVSMKMAKLQKATLDPTKISGRCGRLKCCLRYEFDTYEETQKQLPPVGSDVVTNIGRARVLGQEILSQQVLIATEDNRRVLIPAADVLTVLRAGGGRKGERTEDAPEGDSPAEAPGGQDRPPRADRGPRGPREGGRPPQNRPPRGERRDPRPPRERPAQSPPPDASPPDASPNDRPPNDEPRRDEPTGEQP